MDILKVLSRGTKKTSKFSKGGAASSFHHDQQKQQQQLPSAGTKTNPQLFHDEVRGQKRKRARANEDSATAKPVTTELPEVDFFAAQDDSVDESKVESKKAQRSPSPIPSAGAAVIAGNEKLLSQDECRQILRSHRLKVTLLSKRPEPTKVKKKSSKKKAKLAAAEAEHTKDDKKSHLYPQPLETFSELHDTYGIPRVVANNLAAQGYRTPTEVQLGSLPLLLRPDVALRDEHWPEPEQPVDFLAVAPTGSGKTMSFLVPIVSSMMRRRGASADGKAEEGVHGLEAVILVPTRELAYQIAHEGRKVTAGTGLKIVAMKKGMKIECEAQQDDASTNADSDDDDDEESSSEDEDVASEKTPHVTKTDILITTPLLLLNFLKAGSSDVPKVLRTVRELVLDEADVLLDPLFREQTMGIWQACNNPEMRVSCWSATMGSNIESLATEKIESRAKELDLEPKPLVRLVVGLKDTAVPNITHKLTYTATEQGKLLALRQLLRPTGTSDSGPPLRPPFLVFTQTIDRAISLNDELKYDIPLEAGGSTRIAALHSNLNDSARAAIMRRFRSGEVWVLITTDVLARGVDFAGVNGVVNYDVPGSSAAYVHRAGRTGRAGREGGVAVTFYTQEDIPFVRTVANVIAASDKQAGKTGTDQAGVQRWLLDALPKVGKADRKKLRERGVEVRRTGSGGGKANITSRSGYDRRKENNRRGAMEGNKRRRQVQEDEGQSDDDGGEWGGLGD